MLLVFCLIYRRKKINREGYEDYNYVRECPLKGEIISEEQEIDEKPESRRQDLKPYAYIRSGSIYGLKRDFLMKKNLRYGSLNSRPYILPPNRAINIDNEYDFIVASNIIKNNAKK